jgi:hypothetical protein
MRKWILKTLIRLLNNPYYTRLKKDEIEDLLDMIANDEKLKQFPDYLDQLADAYKNQFLYTQDSHYKGMIAAYVTLREAIVEKKEATIRRKKKEQHRKFGTKKSIVKY